MLIVSVTIVRTAHAASRTNTEPVPRKRRVSRAGNVEDRSARLAGERVPRRKIVGVPPALEVVPHRVEIHRVRPEVAV